MRVLILADVHSNWPALRAVADDCGEFDACLFLGDLVDYATEPVPCIDWIQEYADAAIRGNHDHAIAQRITPRNGGGLRRLAAATRGLHWDAIDPQRMRYLARLPTTRHVTLDNQSFYLVHATPRDPLDEYLGDDASAWQQRLEHVNARLVCVGHSHIPYSLELDHCRVINPGSVGQPRDGDPRAAYVLLDHGRVEFRRVAYDIDETLVHMLTSGMPRWVVDLSEAVLRTGGQLTREQMDAFV
ncbi:MAG: metallophosphoesterase family protein [Planctomycetaceae bacterium]|nr:metallophosphoesterase family protein [Planctomycetaceae bacterium]